MPKATMNRKGRGTVKQPDLPEMKGQGVAPVRNPTLERLAVDWIDAKEAADNAKEAVKTAAESLASQMRNSNTLVYQWDGHLLRLEPGKDKITVKDVDAPEVAE
jgi:hypothetical protein